jgi:hypothetical protein
MRAPFPDALTRASPLRFELDFCRLTSCVLPKSSGAGRFSPDMIVGWKISSVRRSLDATIDSDSKCFLEISLWKCLDPMEQLRSDDLFVANICVR